MSFGGGTTIQQQQPQAPSTSATAREAIQASIDLEPALQRSRVQTQGELTPIQAQQFIDLQQQFGPELGQATQDFRESLDPARFEADQFAIGQAREMAEQGLSEDELGFFNRQLSAQEASAGRLGSPVGSFNVSRGLLGANMQARQQGMSNLQALNQGFAIQPQSGLGLAQTSGASQFTNPAFNMANSNFNNQAGMFSQGQANQTALRGQNMQLLGAGMGALGSLGGGMFGGIGEAGGLTSFFN